ncbi:MAG TPA: hypothetical protein VNG04_05800 [Candidatus Acidoferrum sp.]|nr:hypothetical protein [Candidatus Acidoferrum sp.]
MPGNRLWCCHECKMMGSGYEAGRHVDSTAHPVEQLSQEMSDAVREYHRHQQAAPDAADWMAYAEFRRKAGVAS